MADVVIRRAIKLYIEEKPSNYFAIPDLPKGFYGWGIIYEKRKDEYGVNYVVRYPRIFTSKEEAEAFAKTADKVQRHTIEMYSGFTTYVDKINPDNDYVVLDCTEKLKYKTRKYPNARKPIQIKMPKKDRYQINYEEVFECVYRFNKGIGMATPLDYHNHHYKEIPPLPQRMIDYMRDRVVVKRLVAFASLIPLLFGLGRWGISLVRDFFEGEIAGEDFINLDSPANKIDNMLISRRNEDVPKIETLAGFDNNQLSEQDKKDALTYVEKLVESDYDGNTSLNRIRLTKLLPKGDYSANTSRKQNKQQEVLDDYDSKYNECFHRPNKDNENYEIDEKDVSKYLNKAIAYLIFTNPTGKLSEREGTTVPVNYESSNSEHPAGEEIRTFKGIPDIDKYVVACQAIRMYEKCPNYEFVHQALPPNSNVYQLLVDAKDAIRNRILGDPRVSQEIKIQLLADASDELKGNKTI